MREAKRDLLKEQIVEIIRTALRKQAELDPRISVQEITSLQTTVRVRVGEGSVRYFRANVSEIL